MPPSIAEPLLHSESSAFCDRLTVTLVWIQFGLWKVKGFGRYCIESEIYCAFLREHHVVNTRALLRGHRVADIVVCIQQNTAEKVSDFEVSG